MCAALARGEENTTTKLNWFITVNGVLTDAFEVGFAVFDKTGGAPGTQIFPAGVGTFEPVETGPGHFGTGQYYAYDNGNAQGWTPSLGEPLGTHCIKWRWKLTAASAFQQGEEEFEVIVESAGSPDETYCTVAELRALGVPDETATPPGPTDAQLLEKIKLAQQLFERATRNWFVPRTLQFKFDGTDSDTIHFGIPIIDVEWLKLNRDPTNLDPGNYAVYNARSYPDDRRNPRLKLIRTEEIRDIYTAPLTFGQLKFRKGRQNQEIRGTFGFVEDDMSTPLPVKEAVCRMTIERLSQPAFGTSIISPPSVSGGGSIVEEWTDGHKLKYAVATPIARKSGLQGFTTDPFAQDVIRAFRAPLGIATPAHWSYDG